MYKHILESAGNINWMAILPLLIFFLFFAITIIRVIRKKKEEVQHLSNLPLDDSYSVHNVNEFSYEK